MSSTGHPNSLTLFSSLEGRIQSYLKSKRAAGENFNLFRICGIARNEVYTHSALLCDLLDPSGSHDQGRTFLKLFIETLNLDVDLSHGPISVIPEYYLGPVTDDAGGRLDILIEIDDGRKIAIENKLDAGEQANWVKRYRSFLSETDVLIYLTLDGRLPEEIEGLHTEQVTCISYAKDIIRWLEACREWAATVPIVRESLTQYIHLIRYLTHQENDNLMTQNIITTVVESKEKFEAYCAIRDADDDIRKAIVLKLARRVNEIVPDGFTVVCTPKGDGTKHDGFYFRSPALSEANLYAAISFDSECYRDCFVGFELIDPSRPLNAQQTALLVKHFSEKQRIEDLCPSNPKWPAWKRWPKDGNWDDKVMEEIAFDPESFDLKLKQVLKKLLAVANAFAADMRLLTSK